MVLKFPYLCHNQPKTYIHMKRSILSAVLSFLSLTSFATQFTSNGAGGSWTSAASWTQSGVVDADGIPDVNDTVTINAPAVITVLAHSYSDNLTINVGGTLTMGGGGGLWMQVRGNFDNFGTMNGTGVLYMNALAPSKTLNSPGVLTTNGSIFFGGNVTISAATVIINKQGHFQVNSQATVTNNGNITVSITNAVLGSTGSSTWIQGVNSTLKCPGTIMATGSLDASASGNTVNYNYGGPVTIPVASTYHHLTISGGNCSLSAPLTINGNFTLTSSGGINLNTNNLSVGGNYTTNGGITNMSQITTFIGAGPHLISKSAVGALAFGRLICSGTGTTTLNKDISTTSSINIDAGATLDVSASNFSILCSGNWINNGTFTAQAGTVTFNCTIDRSISGSSITTFNNINMSLNAGRTLSLSFPARLSGTMTFTTACRFNTNGSTFTLLSNFFGTAGIAALPAGATLAGSDWVVQRFVPAAVNPYWDYLATPVTGATIQDWDNDFYMSAVGGNNGTACCPTFYSVRRFNEPTNAYANVTSVGTSITSATGYMCWLADDLNQLSAFTFDTRGTAVFNTQTKAVTKGAGGGFNLIGNVFPSGISWAGFRATNAGTISNTYYILDDQIKNYANWNGTTQVGTGKLAVYNGGDAIIPSSQGFMVVATVGGTLSFNEAHKAAAAGTWTKMNGNLAAHYLRIHVASNMNDLQGETSVSFHQDASGNYDAEFDAPFMSSPYELSPNIGTVSADKQELLSNTLLRDGKSVSVPLFVKTKQAGEYTLTFKGGEKFDEYTCVYLEDLKTGKLTDIKKGGIAKFIAPNGASEAEFMIHFNNNENGACEALAQQPADNNTIGSDIAENIKVFRGSDAIYANFNFSEITSVNIAVFNVLGEKVSEDRQMNISNNQVRIPVDAKGVYIVRVTANEQVFNTKVSY